MTVDVTDLSEEYIGNDSTPTYSHKIPAKTVDELLVTVTDTEGVTTSPAFTLVNPGTRSGGITLTAGNLPSGHTLSIKPSLAIEQVQPFSATRYFDGAAHEQMADRLTYLIAQMSNGVLDGVQLRKDGDGDAFLGDNGLYSPVEPATGATGVMFKTATVASLKATDYQPGMLINTREHNAGTNVGGAQYQIKTAAQAAADGDVIDGYGNHTLDNGNIAVLQVNGEVDSRCYGVVGDDIVDDTLALQAAINAPGPHTVLIHGTCKTTAPITTPGGVNIYLKGGQIYGPDAIKAYHSDHVVIPGWTARIDGLIADRDSAFIASAKAAQSGGFYFDDTGGQIAGAAYSMLTNCASNNHYVGISMWGTHQCAINCTANGNAKGFYTNGSVNTLIHCSSENNTETAYHLVGNGHRTFGCYADGNCADGAALRGVFTIEGDFQTHEAYHMNDNNGAAHFFINNSRRNNIGIGNFVSTLPRLTCYSISSPFCFGNKIEYPFQVTITGTLTNTFDNSFAADSTYTVTSGTGHNYIDGVLIHDSICDVFGNGDIAATTEQVVLAPPGTALVALGRADYSGGAENANMEIYHVSARVYGDGSPQTLDIKIRVTETVPGVGDVTTTLASFAGAADFGAIIEGSQTISAPTKKLITNPLSFHITNDSLIPLKGVSLVIKYRIRSNSL